MMPERRNDGTWLFVIPSVRTALASWVRAVRSHTILRGSRLNAIRGGRTVTGTGAGLLSLPGSIVTGDIRARAV
jgi:hypothetical protein